MFTTTPTMTHTPPKHRSSETRPSKLELAVLKLQNSEDGALEEFIRVTEAACQRLAFSHLKDPDLCKDALQETYLTVYQKIGQLREPKAAKTWLFRILTNTCRSIYRKRSSEIQVDGQDHKLEQADPALGPSESLSQNEELRRVFEQLPEIDRTAIGLREVASLSYEEMSRVLEIPIGTVRSRLAKARKRFLKAYKGEQQ